MSDHTTPDACQDCLDGKHNVNTHRAAGLNATGLLAGLPESPREHHTDFRRFSSLQSTINPRTDTDLWQTLAATLESLPEHPRPHPDLARRARYAAIIRDSIRTRTIPIDPYNALAAAPRLGATEYDIADAVLAERDTELDQLRAERDAAVRLADVWAEAPDPSCRAMAADLKRVITKAAPAPKPRLLSCGLCYEENGEEVHPHPECPITSSTPDRETCRADNLERLINALRRFNQLTADNSSRAHAAQHARDNLSILNMVEQY